MSTNIKQQNYQVTTADRANLLQHKSVVLWFTGLSGSGKSTLANAVEAKLATAGKLTYTLDGDNVRFGLNKDLSFTIEDRTENIRRISEVATLISNAGPIVLTAFISPLMKDRQQARDSIGTDKFIEVYIDCPIEECEKRDVKGLYQKARKGLIREFTGISSPYEAPLHPEIVVNTATMSLEDCVEKVITYLSPRINLD
ncbi:adenylyl-sulfate kinase [Flammeovirga kamogawensis]|uniref:Adenylyl-sulfate kinase n=1 Tax=Flammeovirga kamogawensis TaxID=373891 RepID=A0ABX8GXY7_9BACT|nr:adenylyl-sulfate kinase [Flammeovirga kamogawensis]MBB6458904.1 adenylylsulfate kinase [Flammeovirga kamogawensis]QWG08485.1 adenylyl-sulfate kinase [Flammeovirga kamogawensis]TRX66780.1 adenylyl-sulfate kinase [Flammeovirga kamogawensis]